MQDKVILMWGAMHGSKPMRCQTKKILGSVGIRHELSPAKQALLVGTPPWDQVIATKRLIPLTKDAPVRMAYGNPREQAFSAFCIYTQKLLAGKISKK